MEILIHDGTQAPSPENRGWYWLPRNSKRDVETMHGPYASREVCEEQAVLAWCRAHRGRDIPAMRDGAGVERSYGYVKTVLAMGRTELVPGTRIQERRSALIAGGATWAEVLALLPPR